MTPRAKTATSKPEGAHVATRQKKTPDEKVKYLVSGKNEFVIEVPASWRLTFGYVNPNRSGDGYQRGEGHALRVWEGEKLRAVYCDVKGFRDLSIPLARKVTKETGSATWTMDSQGNFEEHKKVDVESALMLEAGDDIPFR